MSCNPNSGPHACEAITLTLSRNFSTWLFNSFQSFDGSVICQLALGLPKLLLNTQFLHPWLLVLRGLESCFTLPPPGDSSSLGLVTEILLSLILDVLDTSSSRVTL